MLLELKCRIKLDEVSISFKFQVSSSKGLKDKHTSPSGTRGGPAAMSAALVPGRIRRPELASRIACSILISCELDASAIDGDFGPI